MEQPARKERTTSEKALVGPAAEHFVMYRVHRFGMLAAFAPHNFPTADLMIVDTDGATSALVQVKARTRGGDKGWHMKAKHESIIFDRLFYCFVDMEDDVAMPTTYVVPSNVVADAVRESHAVWLGLPPKRGDKPHGDSDMRRIRPDYGFPVSCAPAGWLEKYREQWGLLRPART